jgi:hypothetical protein
MISAFISYAHRDEKLKERFSYIWVHSNAKV